MKVLTYNIHKGFTQFGTRFMLEELKRSIRQVGADLVFLQEVMGNYRHPLTDLTANQFEFLADQIWPHHAYGKNAISNLDSPFFSQSFKNQNKHHGNAILSMFPLHSVKNHDLSTNRFEKRGLLETSIVDEATNSNVFLFNVHLNLLEKSRYQQALQIVSHIQNVTSSSSPMILAGDFNDWRNSLSSIFKEKLQLEEAYHVLNGQVAKSFPAKIPFMPLDRIYFRNLTLKSVQVLNGLPWTQLSDHSPLLAEFT